MHQGQICKLRQRGAGDAGWYQKLRADNGCVGFYPIRSSPLSEPAGAVIQDSQVDSSGADSFPSRPYVISFVLPTAEQVKHAFLEINEDVQREICKRQFLETLDERIRQLRATADHQEKNLRQKMAQEEICRRLYNESMDQLEELTRIRTRVECGEEPSFTYAYGKHNAAGQEFCWRVPSILADRVVPGITAVADTKYGEQTFVVTKVERIPQLLNHKLVLRIA